MNCITCIKGYNITSDTNSCYNYLPNYYYLDDDIFRRCHERCFKCFKGSDDDEHMNCLSCNSPIYFYRKDTFNCIRQNETEETEIIQIKDSDFVHQLFVLILIFSIIISFIFLLCYCCPEEYKGKGFNIKWSTKDEQLKIKAEDSKGKRERLNLDINANKEAQNKQAKEMDYINRDPINSS